METSHEREDARPGDGRVQRRARDRGLVPSALSSRTRPQGTLAPEMLETPEEIAEALELSTSFEARDRLRGSQDPGRERAQRVRQQRVLSLLEGSRT